MRIYSKQILFIFRCLQERLRSNENYRQISHLEEKLTDLIKENKILQESLFQLKKVYWSI